METYKDDLYTPAFVLMAMANLFTVSSYGCFFMLPLFLSDHGAGKADIGIVMGAFTLSSVLCRPWISEMIDRLGRKKSYTGGCLCMSLLPLAYLFMKGGLSDFYIYLLLVRVLHGIGLAICFTAVFTYVADIVPKPRMNEGLGTFGITGLTGMALGPAVGESIINAFGFAVFFFSATLMASVGLALQLFVPESFSVSSEEQKQSFFRVLANKRILPVFFLAFVFGFGLAAFGGFVSPFAMESGLGFVSDYYISYSSAAVLTRIFGGRLADRIGEERIISPALLLTGLGLFLLVFLGGHGLLVASGIISGCGHGFLFPSLNAMAVRNQPKAIRGKLTGIFTGGIDTGVFMGSILLGYIGEWMGFRTLFMVAGLTLILGLIVFRFRGPVVAAPT